MNIKILTSIILALLAIQICLANPLPEIDIPHIKAYPPEIGLWSAVQEDISGDTIFTTGGFAIIDSGVILQGNYFGDPFILDSTNTSGFAINQEGDSIYVKIPPYLYCCYEYFGQYAHEPPPIKGHSIKKWNYRPPGYLMWRLVFSFDFAGAGWGYSNTVLLNEININCTWGNESNFIELYNKADSTITLAGWKLVCDTIYDFPVDAVIPSNGFYVVDETDFPQSFDADITADNIYLLDNYAGNRLVDQVGWSSDHGANVSFMRFPDGNADTLNSYRDFTGYNDITSYTFENGFPSRGAPNRHDSPGFVVIGTRADSIGDGIARIHWSNPIWDPGFEQSVLVKNTINYPVSPDDGETIYQGTDQQYTETDIPPGITVYYTVFARNLTGIYSTPTDESHASITFVGVSIDNQPLPDHIVSLSCYPNPFNARATLSFSLDRETGVKISVYDLSGRLIKNIANSIYSSGKHSIIWNAEQQPSGLYFARLETANASIVKKMVLLK